MKEKLEYEAGQVDATTWMVKRTGYKRDGTFVTDESLLRDMPADTTKESAIAAAIKRGSWA